MFTIHTGNDVSIAEFHQSELVDFPVWVLMQFGLKVKPFDAHGDGIERLRALRIDSVSWNEWFEKLVLSQHTGFRLHCGEAAAFVNKRRTAFNTAPFVYDGMTAFETSLEQSSAGVLERYYERIDRLSWRQPVDTLLSRPVDDPGTLWQGDQAVRSELSMLWERYKARPHYRIHHADDLNRQLVRDGRLCEKIDQMLKDALDAGDEFLMVNFVNYPQNVFAIASSSIVIGMNVDKPFSPDTFMEVLSEAVNAFVNSPVSVS